MVKWRLSHIPNEAGVRIAVHERFSSSSRNHSSVLTCVLIHGFGDGGYVWRAIEPYLDDRFYLIVIDLPGHADSGWNLTGKYSVSECVRSVEVVLKQMGIGDAVIVGHSLGAEIALTLSVERRLSIRCLIIIDWSPNDNLAFNASQLEIFRQSCRLFCNSDEYLAWFMGTRPLCSSEVAAVISEHALRKSGKAMTVKSDPGIVSLIQNDSQADGNQQWYKLRRSAVPFLLVRGEGSSVLSEYVANSVRAMSRACSAVATVRLAGHGVLTDNPQSCGKVIQSYLEGVQSYPANHRT